MKEMTSQDDQHVNPIEQTSNSTESTSSSVCKNSSDNADQTVWLECYDQNSSNVYYWNTETNQVSWILPENTKVRSTMSQFYQGDQDNDINATIQQSQPTPNSNDNTIVMDSNNSGKIYQKRKITSSIYS